MGYRALIEVSSHSGQKFRATRISNVCVTIETRKICRETDTVNHIYTHLSKIWPQNLALVFCRGAFLLFRDSGGEQMTRKQPASGHPALWSW
jgi:hypothetical protein